jgi:RES domain-containing protein
VPDDQDVSETRFVGAPEELVRALDPRYLDSARTDFPSYVSATLSGRMRAGGRYNPPGEFGAIYCADSHQTMWEEIDARYRREGVPGLPPRVGVLRIQIRAGHVVDLYESSVCALWHVDPAPLIATHPTASQVAECHALGRAARAVADLLVAPSARAEGSNYAVFPDRTNSELAWQLIAAGVEEPPAALRQRSSKEW